MPGRSKKDEGTFGERFGGRPSAYKKSETMSKLSRLLLSKPQARDLVYNTQIPKSSLTMRDSYYRPSISPS